MNIPRAAGDGAPRPQFSLRAALLVTAWAGALFAALKGLSGDGLLAVYSLYFICMTAHVALMVVVSLLVGKVWPDRRWPQGGVVPWADAAELAARRRRGL